MIRSQRKFKKSQAFVALNAINSGLSLRDTFEYMGNEVGGVEHLGFTKDDLKRHLQTKRQRPLEYGEAATLLDYFQEQRSMNPAFYSAYLLDEEQQITNIFWADAGMILAYANFGDVLAFDTTYKTNNCHRPWAVFAGFSNNRKTLIFGGALLYDETSASFAWLFKTFLHCMSGKKPKTIFTDQAQAIANGLEAIMPETKHCLCTWHLTMNLRKHYGRFIKGGIVQMWHDCMHVSMSPKQFDQVWKIFIDHWGVVDDAWFKSKYDIRKKWADAFLKDTLTLSMSSTQLSERLNASLKEWLKPSVNIVTFFEHFEKVVNKRQYKERKMVYESRQKFLSDRIKLSPMLYQASQVYTFRIFEKFHIEFNEAAGLVILDDMDYEDRILYKVARFGDLNNVFQVFGWKERENVICSCGRFEMCGYLCYHSLKILDHMNIKMITTDYILKRWTKEARGECVLDFNGLKIDAEPHLRISQRYHSLVPNLVTMASMAALCKEGTQYFVNALNPIASNLSRICLNDNVDPNLNRRSTSITSNLARTLNSVEPNHSGYRIPMKIAAKGIAKNKGNNRSKREKSWYEIHTRKRKGKSIITLDQPYPLDCQRFEDEIEVDDMEYYTPPAAEITYLAINQGNMFGMSSDGGNNLVTTRTNFTGLLKAQQQKAHSDLENQY